MSWLGLFCLVLILWDRETFAAPKALSWMGTSFFGLVIWAVKTKPAASFGPYDDFVLLISCGLFLLFLSCLVACYARERE